MFPRYYRLMVVACALAWLLVGLHLPAVHQMTHHGRSLPWSVVGMLTIVSVAAIGSLWTLLRGPGRSPDGSAPGSPVPDVRSSAGT